MPKIQACKLQILSGKHPGLLQAADAIFDKFGTCRAVEVMVERDYHEIIGPSAVQLYKKKYWQVQKDRVCEQLTTMKAFAQLIGEAGLTAGVNALLWQELQGMKAAELMAFKKVLNDGEKVRLLKKKFALFAQEHRQKMKERIEAAKGDGEVVEDFEAARRMVEQAKEIFGIGRTPYIPPGRRLPGPVECESPGPRPPGGEGGPQPALSPAGAGRVRGSNP